MELKGGAVNNLRIYATLLRDTAGAKALVIEATDKDGRVVRIVVTADDSEVAKVSIALDS